jgi:hypothetical protein
VSKKMKKVLVAAASAALLLSVAVPAIAAKPEDTPKGSPSEHLYLYEKDNTTWEIVEDGAWGKLTYNTTKGTFVFNGHGVMPETEYTVVRYEDPWSSHEAVCLGSGESTKGGQVHVSGDMLKGGPKVWFVLSADVDCEAGKFTTWNGPDYLYEYDVVDW